MSATRKNKLTIILAQFLKYNVPIPHTKLWGPYKMARERIIQSTTVSPFSSNAFFKDDTKFDTPPRRPRTRAKEKKIPHIVKNIPMDHLHRKKCPGGDCLVV